MSLSVTITFTLKEDDPVIEDIKRVMAGGDSKSKCVRRIIARYADILNNTTPSPGEVVRDLSRVIVDTRISLLGRLSYPNKNEVLQAIDKSVIEPHIRTKLHAYIEKLSFAEYAKLIEAVELMYRA